MSHPFFNLFGHHGHKGFGKSAHHLPLKDRINAYLDIDFQDAQDSVLNPPDNQPDVTPSRRTENAQADLRQSEHMPDVYDQQQLGSCTANAIAGMAEYLVRSEGKPDYRPSRLFIYYNERVVEGSVSDDSGAKLSDGIKVVNQYGCAHENVWPYDPSLLTKKPDEKVYNDAAQHIISQTSALDGSDIDNIRECIADGFPFVFGMTVFEDFEQVGKNGNNTMSITPSGSCLGGHAVMAVGYDDDQRVVTVRNSWGPDWGDKGYFYMPYEYISNTQLCSDFWTARMISN